MEDESSKSNLCTCGISETSSTSTNASDTQQQTTAASTATSAAPIATATPAGSIAPATPAAPVAELAPAAASAPVVMPSVSFAGSLPTQTSSASVQPNVVTIPVPIVQNEETYAYITVKASLHDRSCSVFGLNDAEVQALSKRFESVKPVVNGIMVSVPPMVMLNTLAQLSYKVAASCGEAEISWTMQREI